MPDFTQAKTFTANAPATAADQNDAWDNLETAFNASIASVINDSGYTAGAVALASPAGVPTMTTISGDGSLSSTGAFTIAAAIKEALGLTGGGTTRRDYAEVLTEQATSSTTWADVATVGPSVTIECPSGGFLLVGASVEAKAAVTAEIGVHVATDWAISGTPESGESIISIDGTAYTSLPYTAMKLIPITAGSRAVTLKYAAAGNPTSGTFKNRKLWVTTLGGF